MIDKLNEAAKQNADGLWRLCDWQPNWDDLYESFIAGAEWQKAKMMEEAVEGVACILPGQVAYVKEKNNESLKRYLIDNFKAGDKVRIIILPKEDGQ